MKIEADAVELAFDHGQIIKEAVERVRSKLEYSTLAAQFCPPEFTITQLRQVYEAVWNARIDPANFHRKVTTSPDYLRSTGGITDPRAGGGRPARIYSPGRAEYISSPITRSPSPTDSRDKPSEKPPNRSGTK